MSSPLVSVIMPVYNGERYLAEAVDSVLNQTYENWELLVIDDGSSDNSISIIESYEDARIRRIINPQNMGVAKSLNRAVQVAKGIYIARMDSDDICMQDRLATQTKYLDQNPEVMLVGSHVQFLGEKSGTFKYPESYESIRVQLHFNSPFAHPTVMWRADFASEHLLSYQQDPPTAEDYQLWVDFCKLAPAANIPKSLLKYRVDTTIKISSYLKQQYAGGRQIREKLLKGIGEYSESDLDLHNLISEGDYSDLKYGLNDILDWLKRLEIDLIRCGHFTPKAVHSIIEHYIYNSVYMRMGEMKLSAIMALPISLFRRLLLAAKKAGVC